MPCDTIQTSEAVPMAKIGLSRMERALKEAGWFTDLSCDTLKAWRYDRGASERVTFRKGDANATIGTNNPMVTVESIAADVKKTYAAATVKDMAKKFGWKLAKTEGQTLTFRR